MCLRWTITEQFAAPDAMACPSGRSRAPFITPGGRSARSSPQSEPTPYTRTNDRPAPVLGPFHCDHRSDPARRPSTRRPSSGTPPPRSSAASATSTAIPAATPRCNATCGGTAVRHQETFIPLGHLPGRRLEADFGHIHVDFPDGRRLVPFLVTTWAYSNAPFVMALPVRTHRGRSSKAWSPPWSSSAASPGEVWWDNPKTVATLILQGRERQLHPRYAALASHYPFEPHFCMPARGNEKPDAESTVKAVQRRFATPVPRVAESR